MVAARRPTGHLHRGWVLALVVLCGLSLWLRVSHISASLPYPLATDEMAVIGPARTILVTGSLRPKTFNYQWLAVLRCRAISTSPKYSSAGA